MSEERTTEEIASLIESLAANQEDLALAQRLRGWSEEVRQHRNYALRAAGASIQQELYVTLEGHIDEIKRAIDGLKDVVGDTHLLAQESGHRHDVAVEERSKLKEQIVKLAAVLEQIRGIVHELGADLEARPSAEEAQRRMAQIDSHEARLDDHEARIAELEDDQEATT